MSTNIEMSTQGLPPQDAMSAYTIHPDGKVEVFEEITPRAGEPNAYRYTTVQRTSVIVIQ